jgi:predicted RNA-binding protein YlqC (UPF0109 family)
MKELLEAIVKALVDNSDQVQVRAVEAERVTVLELQVHPSDLGRAIGREGRMADSIRTILAAAGVKLRKRVKLEFNTARGPAKKAVTTPAAPDKCEQRNFAKKPRREDKSSLLAIRRLGGKLSNRSAAGARTRTRSIHADHTGLIGVIHVLSRGGRSDGRSRYRVRLVARARTEGERVAALGPGREHRVNQVC